MFEKYIDENRDAIVCQTSRLIQIPSVYAPSTIPSMPFGKDVNNALLYMLELGEKLGFRSKNIDGYCGYLEFGEGKELLGVIGHLDVVPEGEGWTFAPFSGTLHEGKIYGRGAIDDKGPMIAALYAMKAVMDNAKVNKRVRLIIGLNEETEWKCIKHYKEHEESPTISFSPDADFPCIYGEKGFLSITLNTDYTPYLNEPLVIENFDCNNNAINVVPKECSCVIKINSNTLNENVLKTYIQNIISKFNLNIKLESLSNKKIKITSFGISAHAAHPELGINAISQLLVLLYNVFDYYNVNIGFLHFFNNYINTQIHGENFGFTKLQDKSGPLTLNVGTINLKSNNLEIGLNIRTPISSHIEDIENTILTHTNKYKNIFIKTIDSKNSLYIPENSYLVSTLCNIFNEMTGLNEQPICIGGTTYAKAFDNCVSFGANMPGNKDLCHQTDEYISVENLLLASKIYAEAIYKLAQ